MSIFKEYGAFKKKNTDCVLMDIKLKIIRTV